jgi:hypothetical protein
MAITHWDSKHERRELRRAQATRRRMVLIIGIVLALMGGGLVRIATVHAALTPTIVAKFLRMKVNQQLKFSGASGRVVSTRCISNGHTSTTYFFTCRGVISAGGQRATVVWSGVTIKTDGTYNWPKPTVVS